MHLAKYPEACDGLIDKVLEERQHIAQEITSMVLSLRRKKALKVRQPLQAIMIPVLNDRQKETIEAVADLILNEVNVKEIRYVGNDAGVLVKRIKPNFKALGPKYGKIMKALAQKLTSLSQDAINKFEQSGSITLEVNGQQAVVDVADVEIISEDIPGWLVANEGSLTVALDIQLTPALKQEGTARELVNRIQNVRKSKNFDITDKIVVKIEPNDNCKAAVEQFASYIAKQVLAVSVTVEPVIPDEAIELDMDDYRLNVAVEKA